MDWLNKKRTTMPLEVELVISCQDSAAELNDKFDGCSWFLGAYAGKYDVQDVIYFKWKGYNPEKHRLYQFNGYPVLSREYKPTTQEKGSGRDKVR